jgi:hypothetical protein
MLLAAESSSPCSFLKVAVNTGVKKKITTPKEWLPATTPFLFSNFFFKFFFLSIIYLDFI